MSSAFSWPSHAPPECDRRKWVGGGETDDSFFPRRFGIGKSSKLETNAVTKTVSGIRRKRLGGTEIEVSEIGLGTQRWGSADFNAPDEALRELPRGSADRSGLEALRPACAC